MLGGGDAEGGREDEDGRAGMLVTPGKRLGVGTTVWFGLGGGMES